MKLLLAQMKHETNTFSPVRTDLARFARGQPLPYYGDEAYQAYRGTGSALGAFIDAAEQAGAEFTIPIAANAWPSGPVEDDAFEHMCARILDGVDEVIVMAGLDGRTFDEACDDLGRADLARVGAKGVDIRTERSGTSHERSHRHGAGEVGGVHEPAGPV